MGEVFSEPSKKMVVPLAAGAVPPQLLASLKLASLPPPFHVKFWAWALTMPMPATSMERARSLETTVCMEWVFIGWE